MFNDNKRETAVHILARECVFGIMTCMPQQADFYGDTLSI